MRDGLDQMHKLYVWLHLDYGDIIYDHKYDPEATLDCTRKLLFIQYTTAFVVDWNMVRDK